MCRVIIRLEFVGSQRISDFKSLSNRGSRGYIKIHIILSISCVKSKHAEHFLDGKSQSWHVDFLLNSGGSILANKCRELLKFCWHKLVKETYQIFGLRTSKLMPRVYLNDYCSSLCFLTRFHRFSLCPNIGLHPVEMNIFVCLTITLIFIAFNPWMTTYSLVSES
jgi:hypothetical protein